MSMTVPPVGTAAPVSDLDPFDPDVLADPYPTYEQLRAAGPVVWLERYGVWASARYAVVRAALLDHESLSSAAGVGLAGLRRPAASSTAAGLGSMGEPGWRSPSLLLEQDPPDHTRARQVVGSVLSPSAVRQMGEAWTTEAEAMVRDVVDAGECEGISQLARALPLRVFADAVGLPEEGRAENLMSFADFAFNAFGPPNELFQRSAGQGRAALPWVVEHCYPHKLRPGGWGAQIHTAAAAEGYSLDEAAVLVRSLLAAGIDTTVRGLGSVLWYLAAHPEQYALLRRHPGLIRAAFDEAVRLESPTRMFFRTVVRDTALAGVEIPAGGKFLLLFGAANRDPDRWDHPDEYNITRKEGGHLGFGAGLHACIGRIIAYLEAEVMLRALIHHAVTIEVTRPPRWHLNNAIRGLAALDLKFTPAS
jgi:cytochrome P450